MAGAGSGNDLLVLKKLVNLVKGRKPQNRLDGWPKDRGYDLVTPEGTGDSPIPLIIAIHGYTHDGHQMRMLTAPGGDIQHSDSLDALARQEGFAVAYPYGTKIRALPGRCWNAGGGINGFAPVGDPARRKDIDDVRFFRELLERLKKDLTLDTRRIYLVGISNGGAMAQRLAMEHPELWAAVATVAGCNQFAAAQRIQPSAPMSVLHIHGTGDTIWPYNGGKVSGVGLMQSAEDSVAGWVEANGAVKAEDQPLPTVNKEDPTTVSRTRYQNRETGHEVEFYKIEGGGHAWPRGQQYLPQAIMGVVSTQISANQLIWRFFKRHHC